MTRMRDRIVSAGRFRGLLLLLALAMVLVLAAPGQGLFAQEAKAQDSKTQAPKAQASKAQEEASSGTDVFEGYSSAAVRREMVAEAYSYLGAPYLLAGMDTSGIDCSGLTQAAAAGAFGKRLPRRVAEQIKAGAPVNGPLLPGDLVFFNTTGVPSHVGIYAGNRQMIHAASAGSQTGVIVSGLDESYYKKRIVEARRVIGQSLPLFNWDQLEPGQTGRGSSPYPPGTWISLTWTHGQSGSGLYELAVQRDGLIVETSRHSLESGKQGSRNLNLASPGEYTLVLHDRIEGLKKTYILEVSSNSAPWTEK